MNWYGLGGVFSIHSDIVAAPQRPDGEMYATASRLIFFPYRTEDAGDQDVFFASRNKDPIREFCSQQVATTTTHDVDSQSSVLMD